MAEIKCRFRLIIEIKILYFRLKSGYGPGSYREVKILEIFSDPCNFLQGITVNYFFFLKNPKILLSRVIELIFAGFFKTHLYSRVGPQTLHGLAEFGVQLVQIFKIVITSQR